MPDAWNLETCDGKRIDRAIEDGQWYGQAPIVYLMDDYIGLPK